MEYEKIKDLIQTVSNTDITNLSLEMDKFKIEINRGNTITKEVVTTPTAVVTTESIDVEPTSFEQAQSPVSVGTKVVSPIVGTFYESSSPDGDPFVKVGQKVNKGDVLFIIEAMKVINEITAEVSGEVLEILVKNEDFVEFDQPIMIIG